MTQSNRRRGGLLLREISAKFNDHKMITRRNWLLKCSIFANIVVLLYICSHVLVGNNTNNFGVSSSGSSSYLIQQFAPTNVQPQKTPSIPTAQMVQEEQELAAILRNKQMELQKQQIGMQEVIQVRLLTSTCHNVARIIVGSQQSASAIEKRKIIIARKVSATQFFFHLFKHSHHNRVDEIYAESLLLGFFFSFLK